MAQPEKVSQFIEMIAEWDAPGPPQHHYPCIINTDHILYIQPYKERNQEGCIVYLHDVPFSRLLILHETFDELAETLGVK